MPEKDESDEAVRPGRGWGFVAALVVGLPLLYFLSIGPAMLLMEKTNGFGGAISWQMFAGIYSPIDWLYKHTFMKHPIELYLQLWGVK